jgi:transposase
MYSNDFQEKALSVMKNDGLNVRKSAELFKMSKTTLMKRKHEIAPKTTQSTPTVSVNM